MSKKVLLELEDLMFDLRDLETRAREILADNPDVVMRLDSYGGLMFGRSPNPHDVTIEKEMNNMHKEIYGE